MAETPIEDFRHDIYSLIVMLQDQRSMSGQARDMMISSLVSATAGWCVTQQLAAQEDMLNLSASWQTVTGWDTEGLIFDSLFVRNVAEGWIQAKIDMVCEVSFDADLDISGNRSMAFMIEWDEMPYEAYKVRIDGKGKDDLGSISTKAFNLDTGQRTRMQYIGLDGATGGVDVNAMTWTIKYQPRIFGPEHYDENGQPKRLLG